MQRCSELRKLPKAQKFSSILWKYQNPGSATQIVFYGRSSQPLDPTHPATQLKARGLPRHATDALQLRVVPAALLDTPQHNFFPFKRSIVTWNERVQKAMDAGVRVVQAGSQLSLVWKQTGQPVGNTQIYPEDDEELLRRTRLEGRDVHPASPFYNVKLRKAERRVPMSLFVVTSKAKMGSLRCRRKIITSRVKIALNHIVCRGAYFEDPPKNNNDNASCQKANNSSTQEGARSPCTLLRFTGSPSGRQLVLQGWAYIIHLSAEIYLMPYTQLISLLRDALSTVNARAIDMENKWLAQSLLQNQQQTLQKVNNNFEIRKFAPSVQLSTPSAKESLGESESSRLPCTPTPPSHPLKTRSTFDSAVWRRNLTSQLKLLAQASTMVEEGSP